MLKAGKKYNIAFDAIRLSPNLQCQMPIWFHMGGTPKLAKNNNIRSATCLHHTHKVRTVGDMEAVASSRTPPEHNARKKRKGKGFT